ncbi:ATP-binding protein [Streptomyces sp. URMC 129]|uniref:ATP-binding protein n=1 Tax=Streptomyces sp. URMC 129 TaxID=3423407 RepID=UPI003F1BBC5B
MSVREQEIQQWRRVVRGVLVGWGAPRESIELGCFGVSELLTNVLRHVPDPRCCLEVTSAGYQAVVSVFDRSSALPEVREPEWGAESGRGLWLLREMAGELYFLAAESPWGKAVSFRCRLSGEEREAL